ncbi:MAG TPA: DoxX family protein [Rhizobiaceae bacterium]|nr:DoxX family protein [Rhizobiaceae bacterium]
MRDLQLLVARILLVALFFASGFGMLMAPQAAAGYFTGLGMPAAGIVVWGVIALKFLAGLAVLTGLHMRYGALALAAFCIGAAVVGHNDLADWNERTQLLKDFAIAGGFLALAASGPGALSLAGGNG